jgi:hypothetical protein
MEIERAQQQVEADRVKIGETVSEMRELIHHRADQAKRAVDPRTYASEYPWIALGLVVGVGIAVGLTGADRKAAHGVADATKKAGSALGEKAEDAKDFVVEKVRGEEPDPLIYADGGAEGPIERPVSVGQRVLGAIDDVVYRAFEPVLNDMRRTVDGARTFGRRGPVRDSGSADAARLEAREFA